MRYSELSIETQRQAPARARSEGAAMLRRAGYVKPDGELTALGMLTRARLEQLAATGEAADFFAALRLPVMASEGGEYYFPIEAGRSDVMRCEACGYAEPQATARFHKQAAESEAAAPLEKVLTPECHTIEALASYLGIPKEKTAKALMYTREGDKRFVFVVVRGDMQASETKLKRKVGEVRAATAEEIAAAGAAAGYASPIGLKGALIVVDDLIPGAANLVAGANEAGYHLRNTNYGRDYTAEIVADVALAEAGAGCPNCGMPLKVTRCDLLKSGEGYNFEGVMEAVAEVHHDPKGLTLPAASAPFEVYLMQVPGKELDTRAKAAELDATWEAARLRVLFDDRDERAGVKFSDADLIGCPARATVGERGIKDGMVELKARAGGETMLVPYAEAITVIQTLNKAP